jgi:hypothetical protein
MFLSHNGLRATSEKSVVQYPTMVPESARLLHSKTCLRSAHGLTIYVTPHLVRRSLRSSQNIFSNGELVFSHQDVYNVVKLRRYDLQHQQGGRYHHKKSPDMAKASKGLW